MALTRLKTTTFFIINFAFVYLCYIYNIFTTNNSDFIKQVSEITDVVFSNESSCLNKIYDKIFIISSPSRNETLSISIYQLMQENIDFMVWQAHSSNNRHSMDLWHRFKQYIDDAKCSKMYKNESEKQDKSAYYNKMIFFLRQTQLDIIKYSKISNFKKILILEDDITISNTNQINIFCESQQYIPEWLILRLGQSEQNPLQTKTQLRQIHGSNSYMQYYKSRPDSLGAFAISISKRMFGHILDLFQHEKHIQLPLDALFTRKYFTPTKPSKFFVIHPPLFLADRTNSSVRETQYEFMNNRMIDGNKTQFYFSKYWSLRYSKDISSNKPNKLNNNFEILVKNCPCHSYLGRLSFTEPHLVLQIYQMLYDIDKIFTENNITYWIDGGTLLGAVRHKGLIPWDDDSDISVIESEFNAHIHSEKFKHDLSKHGYYIKNIPGNVASASYKIFNAWNVNISMPVMDIFCMISNGTRYNYANYLQNLIWPGGFWYKHHLYPLKRYVFGDIELFGPNYPYSYFDRMYRNWNESKYKDFDHMKEKSVGGGFSDIEDEERQYAKPIGPIQKW